jgi:hypothetical protein
VDFYFGGKKSSSQAKISGQSEVSVEEFWLVERKIMTKVGVQNSPTVYVTNTVVGVCNIGGGFSKWWEKCVFMTSFYALKWDEQAPKSMKQSFKWEI